MQRETIDRANELIKLIENDKQAIEYLQRYDEHDGLTLYGKTEWEYNCKFKEDIHFEPWEVRLMIHNKQQRIKALEKELEELRDVDATNQKEMV